MGYSLVVLLGFLIVVASLGVEHGIQGTGSIIFAQGFSCSVVCGKFLDQGMLAGAFLTTDSPGKPLELNFFFLRKSIFSIMEERKIDFIFNIGMSEEGPQYLISSNMVSKIKSARKKEISLQMDHSRNVKSPRKPSVCVCWPGIREALTQAPGMVNGDEAIAKHGLTLPQTVSAVVL